MVIHRVRFEDNLADLYAKILIAPCLFPTMSPRTFTMSIYMYSVPSS